VRYLNIFTDDKDETMKSITMHRVAVLGAGVMGAQIAAHLANAGLSVMLYDLPSLKGSINAISEGALAALKKQKPTPLAMPSTVQAIDAANYQDHLPLLSQCDLIIEAIAERLDIKAQLYETIAPFIQASTIIASNTSGLSINALADHLPEALRPRFCGVHFFNPPRYMALVESIASRYTDPTIITQMEAWLTTTLGKHVIQAKDTPNFVANRFGISWLLIVAHHAQTHDLSLDTVDALTGELIGLPKSATFRLCDIVGLDTLHHVIESMAHRLPNDPWHAIYQTPDWIEILIQQGTLGAKSQHQGIYRREGSTFHVFNPRTKAYQVADGQADPAVIRMMRDTPPHERMAKLQASDLPHAQFLWACYCDFFHYCAYHLNDVTHHARDLDEAMKHGYGWSLGPFELWQSSGWSFVRNHINHAIEHKQTLAARPLPEWVYTSQGVHTTQGSFHPQTGFVARPHHTVYSKQLRPSLLVGEQARAAQIVFETDGVRCEIFPDVDDRIGVLSFKTRMHVINQAVIHGIQAAVNYAQTHLDGLVLSHDAPFALGADLKEALRAIEENGAEAFEPAIANFQQACLALKYANIPTVAGVQGMALGGGCELLLYCDHRVAAFESYIGLVETGVGLIPAGGGSAYFAQLVHERSALSTSNDGFTFMQSMLMNIAKATTSTSARDAQRMAYLKPSDTILMQSKEVLWAAIKQARLLADLGYTPPRVPKKVAVLGQAGIANAAMLLLNMKDGGFISEYDYTVALAAATALCGGNVQAGSLVDETWLLKVERTQFIKLLAHPLTQARIQYTMTHGKPLRN
jgi:3-hydroxyacyl-CoA dehydrogenase